MEFGGSFGRSAPTPVPAPLSASPCCGAHQTGFSRGFVVHKRNTLWQQQHPMGTHHSQHGHDHSVPAHDRLVPEK